ncbi:hypothetical protein MMC30_003659 [Trapelia coarctata]|nr:hypothetical protein [Trapelia coarctata]
MDPASVAPPTDVFDYIVVGGGTAGLVVACRLTEHPENHVLVLEAGGNQLANPMINIPAMWTAILGQEDVDWAFLTTPQENLNGRILRHPQGKALGGSSALNAEIFVAPSKAEIDAWGEIGNPGWSWESMLPYYRKFHTLNLPSEENMEHLGIDWSDESVRGTSGPIQASYPVGKEDPLSKAWVETFKNIDSSIKHDPFSGRALGGYSSASSINPATKSRSYAGSAYYAPASERSNLTVLTGATVNRVLLDTLEKDGARATGVSFTANGQTQEIQARKEVIIAAGAFQSPKILELSGIGDAKLLNTLGIPVVVDSPNVGENLQDHLISAISFEVNDGIATADPLMRQEPEAIQYCMGEYMTSQTGPFSYGSITSHSFMPITDALTGKGQKSELADLFANYASKSRPDFAFEFVDSLVQSDDEASSCILMFAAQVNAHDDKGEKGGKNYLQMPKEGNYITLCSTLCHPLSRGSVHITSPDVYVPVQIDPKYFSHPLDIEVLARHLQSLENLVKQEPLAQYVKPNGRRNHETSHLNGDLEKTKDYVRVTSISNNHPAGTCPMMPRDKGGVVNERLMVYGTKNLRVVDSSIMPLIPRANLQTTVYAVAEKAADLIMKDSQVPK